MTACRVTRHDDALRITPVFGSVAMHPGQRLHGLQHDVFDRHRRAQRVVGQHDHRASVDEGRRHETLVALVERTPVATMQIDEYRRARRARRKHVELLARGRAIGDLEHVDVLLARSRRSLDPVREDRRVLGNAGAVVVLRLIPGGRVSAHGQCLVGAVFVVALRRA